MGFSAGKNDWAYRAVWLEGGGLVAAGAYCIEASSAPGTCSNAIKGFIVKFNDFGGYSGGKDLDLAVRWSCRANERQTKILGVWPTSDGGVLAAGYLKYYSGGGCRVEHMDAFIAKLDASLNVLWIKVVGKPRDWEFATTAMETTDGNYVLIAQSMDGEIWVGKFDTEGDLLWQRTYYRGIVGNDTTPWSWGKPTRDGGFIFTDKIARLTAESASDNDILFIKFDSEGRIEYAKVLSTPGEDVGVDVAEGSDGYWITGKFNASDLFIAEIDYDGDLEHFVSLVSPYDDGGLALDVKDGLPYVAGYTNNPVWSAGNYDGLVAYYDDEDDCPWRELDINVYDAELKPRESWPLRDMDGHQSLYSVEVVDIEILRNWFCGRPLGGGDELSADEKGVGCDVRYSVTRNGLYVYASGRAEVNVYSADGRRVFSDYVSGSTYIDLQAGVYMLYIRYKEEKRVEKVIIR